MNRIRYKSRLIVVDVEADGPAPGLGSLVSFGAVLVKPPLLTTFSAKTAPICHTYDNFIYKEILGITREEHESYPDPKQAFVDFDKWLQEVLAPDEEPNLISDNNGFDAAWINFYFHKYLGRNPFGWSSRRIGDIYAGLKKYAYAPWKHLRITKHTHDPVADAMGNAEAILEIAEDVRGLVPEIL